MATKIKKVTLKSLQGENTQLDPTKGTVSNPFTQEEYQTSTQTGTWTGGYVEAMGYIYPPMMDGMGDGSGSGSSYAGITYIFDSSGNCTLQYNEYPIYLVNANGSIFSLSHPLTGYPQAEFNPSNSGSLIFRGTMALYRHLANNIPVEWDASYNSDDDAVISTDHQQTSGDSNPISGYASHIHSHPDGNSQPSFADINTWIGMFRNYMRNVLNRYPSDHPNYGYIYHDFNIYIPNQNGYTQIDYLTEYVIPHFKSENQFPNDAQLYKEYKQYLNNN